MVPDTTEKNREKSSKPPLSPTRKGEINRLFLSTASASADGVYCYYYPPNQIHDQPRRAFIPRNRNFISKVLNDNHLQSYQQKTARHNSEKTTIDCYCPTNEYSSTRLQTMVNTPGDLVGLMIFDEGFDDNEDRSGEQ